MSEKGKKGFIERDVVLCRQLLQKAFLFGSLGDFGTTKKIASWTKWRCAIDTKMKKSFTFWVPPNRNGFKILIGNSWGQQMVDCGVFQDWKRYGCTTGKLYRRRIKIDWVLLTHGHLTIQATCRDCFQQKVSLGKYGIYRTYLANSWNHFARQCKIHERRLKGQPEGYSTHKPARSLFFHGTGRNYTIAFQ